MISSLIFLKLIFILNININIYIKLSLFHILSVASLQTTGKTVHNYSLVTLAPYVRSYKKPKTVLSDIYLRKSYSFICNMRTKKTKIFALINKEDPLYHVYTYENGVYSYSYTAIAETCNFTEINTPPWVFFTFFKLYKCYQIAQRTTYLT